MFIKLNGELEYHDVDNSTSQEDYIQDVQEAVRVEEVIRRREMLLTRKRERLQYLRELREEDERLEEELLMEENAMVSSVECAVLASVIHLYVCWPIYR